MKCWTKNCKEYLSCTWEHFQSLGWWETQLPECWLQAERNIIQGWSAAYHHGFKAVTTMSLEGIETSPTALKNQLLRITGRTVQHRGNIRSFHPALLGLNLTADCWFNSNLSYLAIMSLKASLTGGASLGNERHKNRTNGVWHKYVSHRQDLILSPKVCRDCCKGLMTFIQWT